MSVSFTPLGYQVHFALGDAMQAVDFKRKSHCGTPIAYEVFRRHDFYRQSVQQHALFGVYAMNAFKKSLLGAAISAVLGLAATAQAGVVIDLFNDPVGSDQTVSTQILNATVSDQNLVAFPTTSVIGGFRDLSIKKTSDNSGNVDAGFATLTAGFGVLSIDNATGVRSTSVVTWDGANNAGALGSTTSSSGLGGIDLTVGGTANQFLTEVLQADLGFEYKISVWDMDGDKSVLSAGVQFQIPLGSGSSSHYLFDWFNLASGTYCDGVSAPPACANPLTQLNFSIDHTGGAIDFSQIGALQIEFTNVGQASADFALGHIDAVPEPGSIALVGLALLGAGVAGRRGRAVKP